MKTAEYWIKKLDLQPHPEGGYFRETYRSGETISRHALPERFNGDRVLSTCIYYLLKESQYSAFHTIQQDEIWHFYEGAPLVLHILTPNNFLPNNQSRPGSRNRGVSPGNRRGRKLACGLSQRHRIILTGGLHGRPGI